MERAERLANLPEVNGLVTRIEMARVNLETAIKDLDPKQILKHGYELREYNGKLLVYNKEGIDSSTFSEQYYG